MHPIGIDDVRALLRGNGLGFQVIDLPSGGRMLVSQRGGRLMPFLPSGESVLWLSPALGDRERRKEIELPAYNLASGLKRLAVERHVRPALDPLRAWGGEADAVDGVTFHGYEHDIVLRDLEPNAIGAKAWSLIQPNPGGWRAAPSRPRRGGAAHGGHRHDCPVALPRVPGPN